MIKIYKHYVFSFIIIFLIEVFIAIHVHDNFIRPYIGDILVILLIYCFLRIFVTPYRLLPIGVFLFAACVEFTQKFDFVRRLGLENNRILSIVLGSTFDWADIVCYAVGGILTFIWQERNGNL